MPFIARNFISERLIPAIAIEKLIGQFVTLKKSGNNYMGCCPFHHEKTPSFCVTPSKQMFYCFGCKEHGNAIDFLMKYKNLGFVEATEEAAQFAGIEVEYEAGSSPQQFDRYAKYYEIMDRCAHKFSTVLFSPAGKVGMDYFAQKRGLNKDTIIKAGLGYAPEGWHFLQDQVCRSPEEVQMLIDLGMLVKHDDNKIFSMYRNRVMIPIYDRKGRVISFGGRSLGDDKPKYMNTKETPIYRKRNELFGLYEVLKDNNNRPSYFVIVEGYMDVISLRQAGCSTAVASLGTATTVEQFKTMFRYAKKIICCYDGDVAGRNAAWHALNTVTPVLESDYEMRFVFLPKEHDPDSYVRELGLGAFTNCLDNAMSYPEFLISHLKGNYNLQDPGQFSKYLGEVLNYIKAIPLPTLQTVSLSLLSANSGVDERQLYDMLNGLQLKTNKSYEQNIIPNEENNSLDNHDILKTPMRRLMAFILQQPILVSSQYEQLALDNLSKLCSLLKVKGAKELEYLLNQIKQCPDITTARLVERFRNTERERYINLLVNAPLGLSLPDGSELDQIARLELFARLIAMVLIEPLKNRSRQLNLYSQQISPEEYKEMTIIQKELNQIEGLALKY